MIDWRLIDRITCDSGRVLSGVASLKNQRKGCLAASIPVEGTTASSVAMMPLVTSAVVGALTLART
jgi:hypothetical protein